MGTRHRALRSSAPHHGIGVYAEGRVCFTVSHSRITCGCNVSGDSVPVGSRLSPRAISACAQPLVKRTIQISPVRVIHSLPHGTGVPSVCSKQSFQVLASHGSQSCNLRICALSMDTSCAGALRLTKRRTLLFAVAHAIEQRPVHKCVPVLGIQRVSSAISHVTLLTGLKTSVTLSVTSTGIGSIE